MIESALADFHALRQGFSPPAPSSITTLSSYVFIRITSCTLCPLCLKPCGFGLF